MRLTIVQHAGDYLEAFERFAAGGSATYHAQRYSVDFVGSLAARFGEIAVICAICPEPYDVVLPNNVRAIGAGLRPGFDPGELLPFLAASDPERLCMTTPLWPLLRWARHRNVPAMTLFADSFGKGGPRSTIRQHLLTRELNSPNVEIVGNHGIAACMSLLSIGVSPEKIVPWDWPRTHRPHDYAGRTLGRGGKFRLAYVGSLTEAKGVGDLLRALRFLPNVSLRLIGKPNSEMERLASGFDVTFSGLVANEDIPREMRRAHAVVVPSRHDYPEGLPGTIYQALAARTPIIVSDHPMFRGAIAHEQSALIFPERNERALAEAIDRLAHDPSLYGQLSANSLEAWEALQLPVQWGELMSRWVSSETSDREWIRAHRLYSGLYDEQIAARETVLPPNVPRLRRALAKRWTRSEPGFALARA